MAGVRSKGDYVKKGSSVSIRPIRSADMEQLHVLLGDVEAKGAYLPTVMHSEAQLAAEFRQTGFISESSARYLIVGESDRHIGIVWTFKAIPYFDAIEVGYQVFREEDRGKGYGTEAVKLLIDYLFESKPVNRLEIRLATENVASERVAIKAGFSIEGTHREAAFSKGKLYDMHTYAILRREWVANKARHGDR